MESELAVGVALLLFVVALSISRETLQLLLYLLLGAVAGIGSAGVGLGIVLLGLATTREPLRRARLFNKAMMPVYLAIKAALWAPRLWESAVGRFR